MSLDVDITDFFDVPPEEVWKSLTDPKVLADWLMPNDFVAEVGRAFKFVPDHVTPWDGDVECHVLQIVPLQKMVWSWKTNGMNRPSRIEFVLVPKRSGTELHFKHFGDADEGLAKGLKGGWPDRFERLKRSTS